MKEEIFIKKEVKTIVKPITKKVVVGKKKDIILALEKRRASYLVMIKKIDSRLESLKEE